MPPGHLQVYRAGWDPPQSAEGAGGGAGQATLHHLSAVLANRGGPKRLEDCQCNTHLQEGPEGGSRELQACQLDLCAREDYVAVHPECAHRACEGQPGDQAQTYWNRLLREVVESPSLEVFKKTCRCGTLGYGLVCMVVLG